MVEENNAEIHGLRQRVGLLADEIDRFRISDHQIDLGHHGERRWQNTAA